MVDQPVAANDKKLLAHLSNGVEQLKIVANRIYNAKRAPIFIYFEDQELDLDSRRVTIPLDNSLASFLTGIRSKIKLAPTQSLSYRFANNSAVPLHSLTFEQIYQKYRAHDGFLYIVISLQETYG